MSVWPSSAARDAMASVSETSSTRPSTRLRAPARTRSVAAATRAAFPAGQRDPVRRGQPGSQLLHQFVSDAWFAPVTSAIAALEHATCATLLERRRDGVRLTAARHVVLRRAVNVLTELDAAARELAGLPDEGGTVRLGWFASAGAVLVPRALATLRRTHPSITVTGREGSTPALVRALRGGTIDLALLAAMPPFRPFDTESPPLRMLTLTERSLGVAVPAGHPLAAASTVSVEDLRGQR